MYKQNMIGTLRNVVFTVLAVMLIGGCAGQPQFKNPVDPLNWPNQKPVGLNASNISAGVTDRDITLRWTAMTGAVRYRVYAAGVATGLIRVLEVANNVVQVVDRPLTKQFFAVTAINSRGDETDKSEILIVN
ncbi:MAG: hypothetical protein WC955_12695 [Elusimicrobiota bacterium]